MAENFWEARINVALVTVVTCKHSAEKQREELQRHDVFPSEKDLSGRELADGNAPDNTE